MLSSLLKCRVNEPTVVLVNCEIFHVLLRKYNLMLPKYQHFPHVSWKGLARMGSSAFDLAATGKVSYYI